MKNELIALEYIILKVNSHANGTVNEHCECVSVFALAQYARVNSADDDEINRFVAEKLKRDRVTALRV